MILTGYTHRITVPITSDLVIAPEYVASGDPAELAAHCLEAVAPDFADAVRDGDILVVAAHVGASGDTESAVLALQAVGISAVLCVAADEAFVEFAQRYGMPVLICPDAANAVPDGVLLRIDLARGAIEERTNGTRWQCPPAPPTVLEATRRSQLLGRMRRVVEDEGYAD